MGVTQYIGSRYVPVFADPAEWNSTRTYEPLTIVLHEGNSFTSKQYVPAGIDIANADYWAETGNYNAQVEQYRKEVATFDDRIMANADAITNENSRAVAAEKVNADAITAETERAQKAESALGEKPIMVVTGDSWNCDRGSGVWTNSVRDYKVVNVAVQGSGLLNVGPYGKDDRFIKQLDYADAQIDNNDKVSVVYAIGFINDVATTEPAYEELTNAVANFAARSRELFKNAKVVFVGNSWNTGATLETCDAYRHILISSSNNNCDFKMIAGALPVEYLDASQHPNETGSKVLYHLITGDYNNDRLLSSSYISSVFDSKSITLASLGTPTVVAIGNQKLNATYVEVTVTEEIPAGAHKFNEICINNPWIFLATYRQGTHVAPIYANCVDGGCVGYMMVGDSSRNYYTCEFFKKVPANTTVVFDLTPFGI